MTHKKTDERFMRMALAEARTAAEQGEVPVGAVLVMRGRVQGRGHNESIKRNDPTAHAEILAIREACSTKKNYRLADGKLYVTLEPCAMCLGASVQARIKEIVYGVPDPKAGAVVSILKFPFDKTNHRLDVRSGIMAEECASVLKNFFRRKRKKTARRGG